MANYIRLTDNTYPHSESAIRAANPQFSPSLSFSPPEGYALVFPAPNPPFDATTQACREIAPVLVDGKYYQDYEVFTLDAETIAANQAAHVKRVMDEVVFNTQKRLDTFAQTRNYDGILSACTYATSTNPTFAAEGQYAVTARDNTWGALYTIMAEVQAGTRPMPTSFADVEPDLPVLQWPII